MGKMKVVRRDFMKNPSISPVLENKYLNRVYKFYYSNIDY